MALRRQDVIDGFAGNFREDVDGRIFFQPRDDLLAVPVTEEEYHETMTAFERVHTVNMALTLIAFGVAGVYGVGQVLLHDTYRLFFIAFGVACLFTFSLHLRDGLGLLLPFVHRREEMTRLAEEGAAEREA